MLHPVEFITQHLVHDDVLRRLQEVLLNLRIGLLEAGDQGFGLQAL